MKKLVVIKLPHAGLGNKLFVWAQGIVSAKINNCNYIVKGWFALHIRTLIKVILKIEKRHEYYLSPFKEDYSLNKIYSLLIPFRKKLILTQEECDKVFSNGTVSYFTDMAAPDDYFVKIKEYRDLIKNEFFNNLKSSYRKNSFFESTPFIGVHIRRGDMVTIRFTPISYFTHIIKSLREYLGFNLKVIVFTDGDTNTNEFIEIKSLPNIEFAPPQNAVIDMIFLSKANIIVVSDNSTFGKWSGFLSDSVIIEHPNYKGQSIRTKEFNQTVYEGILPENQNDWSIILKQNLDNLKPIKNSVNAINN